VVFKDAEESQYAVAYAYDSIRPEHTAPASNIHGECGSTWSCCQHVFSIQLWSTRGATPLTEQFAYLKDCGYGDVQPYHDQCDDPTVLTRSPR